MARKTRVLRWLAALLCACLFFGNLGGMPSALAAFNGDGNALIPNVNQDSSNAGPDGRPMGSRPVYQVDLLAGTNQDNSLRGKTLNETIKNYRDTYLLDVAADFCVFLQNDFTVYDSDAEGRIAVGGNIVINTGDSVGGQSYAIGTGDYAHVTELEKLIRDRTDAATVVLGGRLRSDVGEQSQISDVYYHDKVKYEGENGDKQTPTHKSNKKIVLNSNNYQGVIPSWATEASNVQWRALLPESPIHQANGTVDWNWTKVDQTQTYLTHLIDFDAQFDALNDYSNWLVSSNPNSRDEVEITFTYMAGGGNLNLLPDGIVDKGKTSWDDVWSHWWQGVNIATFRYTGDPNDKKECVYFNLTEEEFEKFRTCTIIAFENIPLLPDGPRDIIDNDGETVVQWPYSYVVVNVPNSGEVHIGTSTALSDGANAPNYYYGSKVTVFNKMMVSRDYPTQGEDTRNNHPGVSAILYNFPNADTVVLANNFQGTIFAPGAHVTDEKYIAVNQNGANKGDVQQGHLSGAIVAKSFTGYTEFGYRPFSGKALIVSGLLEVSKSIEGTDANPEDEFRFRVTLENRTISDTYGDMEFRNGIAEFTLKAGERMVAKGLPDKTRYTVEEIESGKYVVGVVGEDGVLSESTTASGIIETQKQSTVKFINTLNIDRGTLVIKKTVTGEGADLTKLFKFTVKLSDKTVTGTFDDMTFLNGEATVYLRHNQTAKATRLPANVTYTVTEEQYDNYTAESSNASGTIVKDSESVVTFVNAYADSSDDDGNGNNGGNEDNNGSEDNDGNENDNDGEDNDGKEENDGKEDNDGSDGGKEDNDGGHEVNTGSLTVSKTVTGVGANTDQAFNFTVTLGDRHVTGTYGSMTFVNGVANFSLKHGERKTASGLPAGVTYAVTEEDAKGYAASKTGDTGTIRTNDTAAALFVNAYVSSEASTDVPKTGDDGMPQLWLAMMALALAGMFLAARKARRQ